VPNDPDRLLTDFPNWNQWGSVPGLIGMRPHFPFYPPIRAGAMALVLAAVGALRSAEPDRVDFFERRIRPILVEQCESCHSVESGKRKGGLLLDSRTALLAGGETRAAVVPGAPEKSLLLEAVRYQNRDLQMPPKGRLPDAAIADLERWIADGAVDPREPRSIQARPGPVAVAAPHWAFQPIHLDSPPAGEAIHPIDRFIEARLSKEAMRPNPEADRRTLLRRLSYDLTGLPPSPEMQEAFLAGPSIDQDSVWVDRLMASPAYGERWGRWWLDIARYADTNGQDENKVMANAWRYRDWVVRAFNANRPFDAFITEQLAGDLLPMDGLAESEVFDRWTATGFLVLGPKMLAEQDKPKLVMDLVDEQIDVVGRAFLGLTVSCARCHDHKFDPVPTRDYYALAGIFRSTKTMANLDFVSRFNERRISPADRSTALQAHGAELARLEGELKGVHAAARSNLVGRWTASLSQLLRNPDTQGGDLPAESVRRWRSELSAAGDSRGIGATLRRLASRPDGLEVFLRSEPATNLAAGLRLGPGRIGAGFVADGRNQLDLPHRAELEPAQLSVEAWVRAEDFPADGDTRRWLVSKGANEWADGHFALLLDGNRAGAYLNLGGGPEKVFAVWSPSGTLSANRWHHLAMSFDGALLRVFVDGVVAAETPVGRERTRGNGALVVGRRPDGYVGFRGGLDEIRVHARALTDGELKASFETPGQGAADAVVARWDFNDLDEAGRMALAESEARRLLTGPEGLLTPPKEFRALLNEEEKRELESLEKRLQQKRAAAPQPEEFALAVDEASTVDLPVHIRGSHLNLAKDPVPRGFIRVAHTGIPAVLPRDRSGRLELARWLTSPENPLTARVIVNRVWQAHFGEGLVRTPDNFGLRGEKPSHPELLDWLAAELVRSGWDLKHLHRLILGSRTWRRAGLGHPGLDPAAPTKDPDNRLLAWFPRQRLEAEMVRDALLAVSGRLDPAIGGSLVSWKNDDYTPEDSVSADSVRRSLYLPVVRDRVYDVFTIFDFANPSVGTARRTPTVVSHQALFFLNSPLVKASASALASRLLSRPESDAGARIQEAYRAALGRPASASEAERAGRFVRAVFRPETPEAEHQAWTAWCQVLLASNEFLYRE